jgi:hypothetical protein
LFYALWGSRPKLSGGELNAPDRRLG